MYFPSTKCAYIPRLNSASHTRAHFHSFHSCIDSLTLWLGRYPHFHYPFQISSMALMEWARKVETFMEAALLQPTRPCIFVFVFSSGCSSPSLFILLSLCLHLNDLAFRMGREEKWLGSDVYISLCKWHVCMYKIETRTTSPQIISVTYVMSKTLSLSSYVNVCSCDYTRNTGKWHTWGRVLYGCVHNIWNFLPFSKNEEECIHWASDASKAGSGVRGGVKLVGLDSWIRWWK